MALDIFMWWLVAQLVGLAGLPLAAWLLRALPDSGYAFAKSLGLLLAGYLAWMAAMLGLAKAQVQAVGSSPNSGNPAAAANTRRV